MTHDEARRHAGRVFGRPGYVGFAISTWETPTHVGVRYKFSVGYLDRGRPVVVGTGESWEDAFAAAEE